MYWIEDSDGLPLALASTTHDGTPLTVAEQWWTVSRALLDWADSDAPREWLRRFADPGE